MNDGWDVEFDVEGRATLLEVIKGKTHGPYEIHHCCKHCVSIVTEVEDRRPEYDVIRTDQAWIIPRAVRVDAEAGQVSGYVCIDCIIEKAGEMKPAKEQLSAVNDL